MLSFQQKSFFSTKTRMSLWEPNDLDFNLSEKTAMATQNFISEKRSFMKLAHLRDLSLCNDLGARLYQAAATYYK